MTFPPDRSALPGQRGMLGVASRQADGRTGKVFSVRLSDAERTLIQDAAAKEAERGRAAGTWERYGGAKPVGQWMREAALARAREVVTPASGSTGSGARRARAGTTARSSRKTRRR
jgi:hypothetical protein